MSADSKRSSKVEAVILQHSDWGEADRLLRIFSREQGKLKIVAKGARRIRSRKAGHLEPVTRVSLLLCTWNRHVDCYTGRNSECTSLVTQ